VGTLGAGAPVDGFVATELPPQAASRTEAPTVRAIRTRFMLAMFPPSEEQRICADRIRFHPIDAA
jgi:hypothetical protein